MSQAGHDDFRTCFPSLCAMQPTPAVSTQAEANITARQPVNMPIARFNDNVGKPTRTELLA